MEPNVEKEKSLTWQQYCIEAGNELISATVNLDDFASAEDQSLIDAVMKQLFIVTCSARARLENPEFNERYKRTVEVIVRETEGLSAVFLAMVGLTTSPAQTISDIQGAVEKHIPHVE